MSEQKDSDLPLMCTERGKVHHAYIDAPEGAERGPKAHEKVSLTFPFAYVSFACFSSRVLSTECSVLRAYRDGLAFREPVSLHHSTLCFYEKASSPLCEHAVGTRLGEGPESLEVLQFLTF